MEFVSVAQRIKYPEYRDNGTSTQTSIVLYPAKVPKEKACLLVPMAFRPRQAPVEVRL